MIDAATGKVMWNVKSSTASQPASTMKLLTGAALLTKVNPNSRLTTKVVRGTQPATSSSSAVATSRCRPVRPA